jgi:uncharacterized protein YndB with AHSA1/START domain
MPKKIARWVALGLGVAVVLAVLGSLLTPRHPTVTRSIDIAAAPAGVFPLVSDLRRFNEWSPWFERDPTANFTFTGPTDGVGQTFHWQSDMANVGSGSMSVAQLDPDKRVDITVELANRGAAATWFTLTPQGSGADVGTKVTWGLTTDLGFNPIARYSGLMIDDVVGPDYERGLARLKAVAEKPAEPPKEE